MICSICTNCEKTSTLWPPSTTSKIISLKASNLPEGRLPVEKPGRSILSRRGWQQIWRSLSRASRMDIWLLAMPLLSTSAST